MIGTAKTSESHPLRIDTLSFGAGAIGITFCPGKQQSNALSGRWARSLQLDLDAIGAWGCTEVMSLVEPEELVELEVPQLGESITSRGWLWHHWPITDGAPPDERFLDAWGASQVALRNRLREGGRLVIHCKGGLGRAGTIAAILLAMESPTTPISTVIARVRAERNGAIETDAQERFLCSQTWRL